MKAANNFKNNAKFLNKNDRGHSVLSAKNMLTSCRIGAQWRRSYAGMGHFLSWRSGAGNARRSWKVWAVGAVSGGQFLAWVKRKYAQPHDVWRPPCHRLRWRRDIFNRHFPARRLIVSRRWWAINILNVKLFQVSAIHWWKKWFHGESMSSSAFRDQIVALGAPDVTSLWHQQQKNPPFVLLHDSYEFWSIPLTTLLLQ